MTLRFTFLWIRLTILALVLTSLQTNQVCGQATDEEIASLTERLESLPDSVPWQVKQRLLLQIIYAYEGSMDWERAQGSIEYRVQMRELFEQEADLTRPQPSYHQNQFRLRFYEELNSRPSDADEIWKHVKLRQNFRLLLEQQKHVEAVELADKLVRFFQDKFGEDSYWAATSAADHRYAQFQDYRPPIDSEAVFRKAIRITSKVKDGRIPEIIDLSRRLASWFNYRKEFTRSSEILEKCHQVSAQIYGANHPATLGLRYDKSTALIAAGQFNNARKTLAEIDKIVGRRKSVLQYQRLFVKSHLAMTKLEFEAGNFARALKLCEELYSKREQYQEIEAANDWLAENLVCRTEVLIAIEDDEELARTVQILSDHMPNIKTDWTRKRAMHQIGAAYLVLGELDLAEQYFTQLIGSRAILSDTSVSSFLAQINRARGNDEEALGRFQQLVRTKQKGQQRDYESLILRRELGLTYRKLRDHENELRCFLTCLDLQLQEYARRNKYLSRIDKLDVDEDIYHYYYLVLEAMQGHSGGLDANRAFEKLLAVQATCDGKKAITLDEFLVRIPAGAAIVQLISRTTTTPSLGRSREFDRGVEYSAFVIQRGAHSEAATISWFDIGEYSRVNSSLKSWKDAIEACLPTNSNRGIRKVNRKNQTAARNAGEDFQRLLRPMLNSLSTDVKNVVVCPTGIFWDVPWNALQRKENGPYLVESCLITSDSTSFEALESLLTREEKIQKLGMTLVCDLDFGSEHGKEIAFPALPATKQESEKVILDWGNNNVETFSRLSAIKDSVLDSLKRTNVAYFATHVFMDLPDPLPKKSDQQRYESLLEQYQNDVDAFTYQSIVLSSANKIGEKSKNQLLASEILEHDLSNLDLVVLSSCSSASGANVSKLGNCGVQRAFRLAGSKTVIGSLWPAEDEITRELMSDFSENHFKHGKPPSMSLRLAILKQIKTKPFHLWAGWTVLGR